MQCLPAQREKARPWCDPVRIGARENDGIVNTGSMFWPDTGGTVLVLADHMDIVGHYRRVKVREAGGGRIYRSYDLLRSGSGFDEKAFAEVWDGVFTFCTAAAG